MTKKRDAPLSPNAATQIREMFRRAEKESSPVARMLRGVWGEGAPFMPSFAERWVDLKWVHNPAADLPPRVAPLPESVRHHWRELEDYLNAAPADETRDIAMQAAVLLGYGLAAMAKERGSIFELADGRRKKSDSASKRASWLRAWLADPARNWPVESLAVTGSEKQAKARMNAALIEFAKHFGLLDPRAEDPLHRARDKFRRAREALKKT